MDKKRILIVDDEADLCQGLTRLFSRMGYEVHAASDGRKAMHTLKELGWCDCIILDVMMPGMDGLETMEALAQSGFDAIPVILLTARFSTEDVAQGHDHGATVFMRKPFSPTGLVHAVEYALSDGTHEKRAMGCEVTGGMNRSRTDGERRGP